MKCEKTVLWKIHGHCHQPCKLYYVIASRTNLLIGWTRILSCLVKKWWHTYPSRAPEFTPVFSGIRVTRSLVLYVCFVERCLSFCPFSFGHCVVCFFCDVWILIAPLISSNSSYYWSITVLHLFVCHVFSNITNMTLQSIIYILTKTSRCHRLSAILVK